MQIVLTVASILIVLTGVAFRMRSNSLVQNSLSEETTKVLSASDSEDDGLEDVIEDSDVEPTLTSTSTPAPTKPQETEAHQQVSTLEIYKYPNSQTINSTGNALSLVSNDGSDKITNWYKERIRSEGLNVKSFVTTKTNGNVLNKLVGASGWNEVSIEIKKDANARIANILIERK